VLSLKNEIGQGNFFLWGGSPSCIRKIAVFGTANSRHFETPADFSELPIRVLKLTPKSLKFAESLSHRDFLGAIMALGIDRGMTGDIVIKNQSDGNTTLERTSAAYVYVLENSLEFIKDELTEVRKTPIICEECQGEISELEVKFESIKANIASERLDLFIGVIAKQKREAAKSLLSEKKVFINGKLSENPGQKIKAGDEITVRGFGKYIYDGLDGTSRKGRSIVSIRKYS